MPGFVVISAGRSHFRVTDLMDLAALTAAPGGGCFGLAVLLREGVAAWIEHCAASPRPAPLTGLDTVPCSAIAPPLHAGIVQILASIALNRIQEIQS